MVDASVVRERGEAGSRRSIGLALIALFAALCSTAAGAATLDVRVQDRNGEVLPGAGVCAGTRARDDQFGARLTDREGRASFRQLPATDVLVTVSRPGYKGERLRLGAGRFDRLVIVTLVDGGLGPACEVEARASGRSAATGLRISQLRVRDIRGAGFPPEVVFDYELLGEANQYRASEHADFEQAAWRPLSDRPSIRLSDGHGRKTLYFQVRRHEEVGDGALSIESNVAAVDVTLDD